jgi:hypothetical protein
MDGTTTYKGDAFCACPCDANHPTEVAIEIAIFLEPCLLEELFHGGGELLQVSVEDI